MLLSPRTATGILPRRQTWRALLWAGVLGILGVMTGYAAFVAWVAEHRKWWEVLGIVAIVAVIAAIGEQARHIISHGATAPRDKRPFSSIASILAGFAIVLLFEIANAAWDKGAEKLTETLSDMLALGYEPIDRRFRFLMVVLVWIASGAMVAMVLVRRILSTRPVDEPPAPVPFAPEVHTWQALAALKLASLWRSRALRGGFAAALIAGSACAVLLFASAMLVDGLGALYTMVKAYWQWRDDVQELANSASVMRYLAYPALWLDAVLSGWFAPILARLWWMFAFAAGYLWWRFAWMRAVIILAIIAVVFVPPVALRLSDLLRVSLLYALVWAIPAFVLGAASPYLRDYRPHQWGRIACLVAFGLALLALLQASFGGTDVLSITAICAALTLLIGLILIFAPPTREYLPLIAVVCGLLSYAAANLVASPSRIFERVVFLHAPSSNAAPFVDAAPLAPPTPFILPLDGRDWEIGKEVYGRVQDIAQQERKHPRWVQMHDVLAYVTYLRDPLKSRRLSILLRHLPLSHEQVPHRYLFVGQPQGVSVVRVGARCSRSPMECLAELAEPPQPGASRPDWTLPMLQAWATKVADALEADLRWRWVDQAIGTKLHIALSGAIGFFLALAGLIAWQIRNACENSDGPPHGDAKSAPSP